MNLGTSALPVARPGVKSCRPSFGALRRPLKIKKHLRDTVPLPRYPVEEKDFSSELRSPRYFFFLNAIKVLQMSIALFSPPGGAGTFIKMPRTCKFQEMSLYEMQATSLVTDTRTFANRLYGPAVYDECP